MVRKVTLAFAEPTMRDVTLLNRLSEIAKEWEPAHGKILIRRFSPDITEIAVLPTPDPV